MVIQVISVCRSGNEKQSSTGSERVGSVQTYSKCNDEGHKAFTPIQGAGIG